MRTINVVLAVAVVAGFGVALLQRQEGKAETPATTAEQGSPPAATGVVSAPDNQAVIEGEVLERLEVSGYVYLRIGAPATPGTWTAVASTPLAVGARARVVSSTRMESFRSETLDRTFDSIYFGELEGDVAAAPAPLADPHQGLTLPSKPEAVKVGQVEKATGDNALRIDELYAKKSAWVGKTVRVRGVVVKSTSGILGKTFVHLRDGSGDEAAGTNDLTLTTEVEAVVGDTVTAEGVVAVDRDIGAGYRYAVIVEGARLNPGR